MTVQQPSEAVMPRSCPSEFRRKVLDLVASGRKVAEVAQLLGISDQAIYVWRRHHLIDTGQLPGTNSIDQSELTAARKRIAELEAELAIHPRAAELLGEAMSQKAVRSHPRDGR
ncbi:transposase [Streptomyces sp. NPDC051665]|uniref:transposase n=1 Tax=Streptomyces sp. NPDC051665 TaxID=3154647 RepID=UPI00344483E2